MCIICVWFWRTQNERFARTNKYKRKKKKIVIFFFTFHTFSILITCQNRYCLHNHFDVSALDFVSFLSSNQRSYCIMSKKKGQKMKKEKTARKKKRKCNWESNGNVRNVLAYFRTWEHHVMDLIMLVTIQISHKWRNRFPIFDEGNKERK